MVDISSDLISATIGDFCRLSGIGRSRVYELLDAGTLDSIKIGKRRLVLLDSYRRLIEQQQAARAASDPAGATAQLPCA